jgi:hypothetical protein
MKNKSVRFTNKKNQNFLLNRMLKQKANGYVKVGTFSNELVWGNYSYIFSNLNAKKQKSFKRGMFLFGMVRKDVKSYLKTNPDIKLPKQHRQIEYNGDLNEEILGKITGTDLNHAYWRIAFNLGIISANTYVKGLDDDFKSIRLAALSTMGATKKYQIIEKGVLTNKFHTVEGDETLRRVYTLIRYTCYKYMAQLKKILGYDFLCYKTDAIYYIDTKENRQRVKQFLMEKDLLMKQLEYEH